MCCLPRGLRRCLRRCCDVPRGECGLEPDNGMSAHDVPAHARRVMILWFVVGVLFTVCIQATALAVVFAVLGLWYVAVWLAGPVGYGG